jgi:hypothetical protein
MKAILDYELGGLITETLELEKINLQLYTRFVNSKDYNYLKTFCIDDWHCKQLSGQYVRTLELFNSINTSDNISLLAELLSGDNIKVYPNEKYHRVFVKDIQKCLGVSRYLIILVKHTDRLLKRLSNIEDMSKCVKISLDLNKLELIITQITEHCNTYFKLINPHLERLVNEPDQ